MPADRQQGLKLWHREERLQRHPFSARVKGGLQGACGGWGVAGEEELKASNLDSLSAARAPFSRAAYTEPVDLRRQPEPHWPHSSAQLPDPESS